MKDRKPEEKKNQDTKMSQAQEGSKQTDTQRDGFRYDYDDSSNVK